jgi:hypothetical protein
MANKVIFSANPLLKGYAVLMLYIFVGHPSVYAAIWHGRNWYLIVIGAVMTPVLLVSSIRTLAWRIRIDTSVIEIWSLKGVFKRQISDVAGLERIPGRVFIDFKDGSRRAVPAIVGDLDRLVHEISVRRSN